MTSKIRIRIGDVEVEYEGPEDFLRKELRELLSGVLELHREQKDFQETTTPSRTKTQNGGGSTGSVEGTTNTLAAKLSVLSGTGLIIAACARLTLGLGHDTFTRSALLKETQTASSYYKKTYSNNFSQYLKTFVTDNRLRELSKDIFALSAGELQKLKTQLAS